MTDVISQDARSQVRDSFYGSRLTDCQTEVALNIAGIFHREIHKSGSFRSALTDYAHVFAREEKFDALKGEEILRDVYKARFGQSMNETRKGLMERETILQASGTDQAALNAQKVCNLIKAAPTMPFYRAQDIIGTAMARQHGITDNGAKKMMSEAFEQTQGKSFYETGKAIEAEFHLPVREAEQAARKAEHSGPQKSGPSRG